MPYPHQATALTATLLVAPMGLLHCPAVRAKGKSAGGDGPSLPAQVTFCPLGSEPTVLGHSLQKSINTAPSPLLRTGIRGMGPETVVTSSFLPFSHYLLAFFPIFLTSLFLSFSSFLYSLYIQIMNHSHELDNEASGIQ